MKSIIEFGIIIVILTSMIITAQNQAPVVENVRFTQRTDGSFKVDIYYDVNDADGDSMTISMLVSEDAGSTFDFLATSLSGDFGENIKSGTDKHIEWNFASDHPNYFSDQIQIKIVANDNGGYPIVAGMIFVEGGTFQMGSNDGYSIERPEHSVTLNSFYIGKYEVTQAEWQKVMGNNPSSFVGDTNPVENVTWNDAITYCNKLSEEDSLTKFYTIDGTNVIANWGANGYRLPTEAEWEYAGGGGAMTAGYNYCGGNNANNVAWYSDNSEGKTHEVGTKLPNVLGLYDMSGNIIEWCNDLFGEHYYSDSPINNPQGPTTGDYRVFRGGSWNVSSDYCRVKYRGYGNNSSNYIGFRIVRNF